MPVFWEADELGRGGGGVGATLGVTDRAPEVAGWEVSGGGNICVFDGPPVCRLGGGAGGVSCLIGADCSCSLVKASRPTLAGRAAGS